MGIAAATGTRVFLAFVEQVLIPALRNRPDAVVVMDNLAAHKAEAVRHALEAAGIAYRYLPSYSRALTPIGACGSKLRGCLRAEAARSLDALDAASARRWPRPPPRTPRAGSASPATPPPTDLKSA